MSQNFYVGCMTQPSFLRFAPAFSALEVHVCDRSWLRFGNFYWQSFLLCVFFQDTDSLSWRYYLETCVEKSMDKFDRDLTRTIRTWIPKMNRSWCCMKRINYRDVVVLWCIIIHPWWWLRLARSRARVWDCVGLCRWRTSSNFLGCLPFLTTQIYTWKFQSLQKVLLQYFIVILHHIRVLCVQWHQNRMTGIWETKLAQKWPKNGHFWLFQFPQKLSRRFRRSFFTVILHLFRVLCMQWHQNRMTAIDKILRRQ